MKNKIIPLSLAALGSVILLPSPAIAEVMMATVTGDTERVLASRQPIPEVDLTILETGETFKSDKDGKFTLNYPVGETITLVASKPWFRTIQTATIKVPPEGLTGPHHSIGIEMFDQTTFLFLAMVMGKFIDESKCHVFTMISAYNKTLDDLPQGEADATVELIPATSETPYYFDIFKDGPFKDYINPFTWGLTKTTAAGDVVFANVEPSDIPYTVKASKAGVIFSEAQFICQKGMFIELNTPHGPSVQKVLG